MKKIATILLPFFSLFAFAQNVKLEPGIYKSNVKGQKIKLTVFENENYEMSFLYGKYAVSNDTIHFSGKGLNESNFVLKPNKEAPFSSTLKLKFNKENMFLFTGNLYIGTQVDANSMIDYKPLLDYIKDRQIKNQFRNNGLIIDLQKTKYIYFVENRGDKSTITKFQIDTDSNEVEVNYNGLGLNNIQLAGVIDPKTKNLTILEGRQQVLFSFEKDTGSYDEFSGQIKPDEVKSEKNWLKNNGFEQEENTAFFGRKETSNYTYKHTLIKSFADGLKSVEKFENKFLVVSFDSSKDSKTKFASFIKESENELSNGMYDGYDIEKDHFNFYLATDADKKILDKLNIKDASTLLFYNSSGDLIYHTSGTLDNHTELFNVYYSIYPELESANRQLKMDKICSNKKATLPELRTGFIEISKVKKKIKNEPEATALIETDAVVEEDYGDVVADTTAVAIDGDENYFHVQDRENLYAIKTPRSVIASKWKLVLDYYCKNSFDVDFLELVKAHLSNKGFLNTLYDEQPTFSNDDVTVLEYVFKNYELILKEDAKVVPVNNDFQFGIRISDQLSNSISDVLAVFFKSRLNTTSTLTTSDKEKLIVFYKKHLQLSDYKLADFRLYLTTIDENNPTDKTFYFEEYNTYVKFILAKNESLIETLDTMYASQNSIMDWVNFKKSFSDLANTVAWDVVEFKINTNTIIQNAIKWSEMSLKIDPKNAYYLDTLGQLYYKNGEKEKAILTEQKAIDAILTADEIEFDEYLEVLEKMKNGTY